MGSFVAHCFNDAEQRKLRAAAKVVEDKMRCDRGDQREIGAGVAQALGFLALTFGLASDAVSVVYPITSTAPLFALGFAAIFLRGTETVTWRLVLGVVAVTAGVVVL